MQELLKEREQARKKKDWARADEIREKMSSAGWAIEDTPKGPRLKKA
jgi:cysteinyl-tRNA synthetase